MTPGARVQAAINIIDRWAGGREDLGRVLTAWGRANRYAGSGDRRAIADLVHNAVRRLRSAAWTAGADEPADGRSVMIGSLLLDDQDPETLGALFTGERHMPAPLSAAELAHLGRPLAAAPREVRLDFPDWLARRMAAMPDETVAALRSRAPLFLRVNLLRTDRVDAIAALRADGVEAEPGPRSPSCLRVVSGERRVTFGAAYRGGLVEIQDASSQAAADYAAARPGETVLDYCAGAGGKALALAGAMQGQGALHAHDIAPARLAQLGERAARAGARIRTHAPGDLAALSGRCDLVFVDAPCSGSGAWRRNPDAKWRLTPEMLEGYVQTQRGLIAEAAAMLRPGGRLVYATCSILDVENRGQCAAVPGLHPGRPPLDLMPGADGDGFFACELLPAAG